MKYKKQRNIKFAVMFVVIGGLLAFLATEELTGNPNLGAGKTFTLPPPNTFKNVGGAQVDVECKIKQELTVVDSNGKTITVKQSTGIIGSPTFNIVNPSNINQEASVFVVIPKIFCEAKGFDVVVEKSDLKLTASVGEFKETQNIRYQTEHTFKANQANDEERLGWFSIYDRDIESIIPEKDFSGTLVFDVTGNIVMHYDEPSIEDYKMTIPINSGDLVSYWNFKNIGENDTNNDQDNDGIKDNVDSCPSVKETYNDYQDTDGCPDTVPIQSTPVAPVTPVDKNSCNAQQKTWYSVNTGDGLCSTKFITQDGEFCKEYDVSVGVNSCVDPKPVSSDISAQVKFQIYVEMAGGGRQDLQATDDPNPFDVSIPLSLLGNSEIIGQTGAFNVEPRLVISDQQKHTLTDTKLSNLNIETFIKVKGSEYSLGKDNVNGFLPKNGGSIDQPVGFPLGSIKVSSVDIQNAIPVTIVPMGTSENVDLRFLVSGDVILSVIDDNQRKNVSVDLTGADFEINNLQIVRSDASTPISTPTPTPTPYRAPNECAVDETEQVVGNETVCITNTVNTKPDELSCKANEYVLLKDNGIPECALKTGSVDELQQCPQGTEQCVIISDNTQTSGGNSTINPLSSSDNNSNDIILYGAIGLLVLGLIAFILKRRN